MAKGLAQLTNAANRTEAWKDWRAIKRFATENDMTNLATSHQPPDNAGWRKIDKCIAALRAELSSGGLNVPQSPSSI